MIRRILTVVVFAACLMALGGALPAFAATHTGKVVMKTAGAPLPGGLKVTVVEIAGSGDMTTPQHVPMASDGTYNFEGDPALSHLIGTILDGVTYSMIAGPGELPAKELPIFETTTDVSVVEVASDTVTVLAGSPESDSDVFEVLGLQRFKNSSDRTFIGESGDGAVLKLPVPEAVFDVAPADEANSSGLAMSPRGLVTTVPLQPGESSVPYLYKVKVPRTGWQLRREVVYPTGTADLLIDQKLELNAAPGFEFVEKADLGGQQYNRYRKASLAPGEEVAADVGFGSSSDGKGVWYGTGTMFAVIATVLLAAGLGMRRRRKDKVAPRVPEPTREELIDRVALLDENFETGELDKTDYEKERSKLLAQLKTSS